MYLPHDLASPLTSSCSSWIVLLLFLALSAFLAAVFACADLPSGDQTVSLPISKRSSKRSHPTSCGKIQPGGGGQAGVLGVGGKVAKKKATPLVKALANPSYSRQSPVKGATPLGATALGTSLDGKSKCTVIGPSRLRLVKGGKASGRTSPKKGPPHTKTDRASPKKAPAGKISPKPACSKVALCALKSTYSQYSFARVEPRKTEILPADSSEEELPSVIPTPEDF